LKELIKLFQLPDYGGYSTFLYVSDKTNDATFNELINHKQLHIRIVEYNKVLLVLHDLINANNVYENILNKNYKTKLAIVLRKIYLKLLI
jgi:hypothetical protein